MNSRPDLPGTLLDNLLTAVVLLDTSLVVHYVNPAAEQLLGISARRLLQHRLEQVVEYILGAINRGEYKSGDKLPSEREFSEKLGVSRVSLREAISALSARPELSSSEVCLAIASAAATVSRIASGPLAEVLAEPLRWPT